MDRRTRRAGGGPWRDRRHVRGRAPPLAQLNRQLAHTKRLKLSARAVIGYSLFPELETVEAPVAVAYASTDTLHEGGDVRRIVETLPHGRAVECPSNTYMHTPSVAADLRRFLTTL